MNYFPECIDSSHTTVLVFLLLRLVARACDIWDFFAYFVKERITATGKRRLVLKHPCGDNVTVG